MSRSLLIVGSLAVHGVALLILGEMRGSELVKAVTKIEVFDSKPPEPPAKPPPPPPKPKPEPARAPPRAPAPEALAPPPLATDSGTSSLSDLPDFGLSLSGGIAVAAAARPAAPARKPSRTSEHKPERASANLKSARAGACSDPSMKPKVLSLPRPVYPEQARAAGVAGRVRLMLTVDAEGNVSAVRVLAGLGYGLDEAALQAAKQARFQPVVRCGKPEASTFTVAIRFTAG